MSPWHWAGWEAGCGFGTKAFVLEGSWEATTIQEEEEIRDRKPEIHLEALFHGVLLVRRGLFLEPLYLSHSPVARGQGWTRMCVLQSPGTVSYSVHPVRLNILAKYLSYLKNNLFLLMITEKGVLTTSH